MTIKSLAEIADIEISGVDKKTNEGEQTVKLCNFTDVYYNWDLDAKDSEHFMIASATPKEIDKFALFANDVVITKDSETRDDIGISCHITEDMPNTILGYHCALIRPHKGIDGGYLNACLKTITSRKYFSNQASGSGQRYTLSVSGIGSVRIPIVDYEEQKKIARLIANINNKVRCNNRINDNLQQLIRLIYNDYFIQFRVNRKTISQLSLNKQLKRQIPNDWTVKPFESLVSEVTTGLNPRDNFKLTSAGYKYITVKNLTSNGTLVFDGCDFVDESAKKQIQRRAKVKKGDILFASIAPLGRCYAVLEDPFDWVINESVFCIKPKDESLQLYLYLFLTSDFFIKKAEHSSAGSIFSGIRISTLNTIPTVIPSDDVIRSFNQTVMPLFDKINAINKENTELLALRKDILPLLMNGQVSLR